MGCYVPQTEWEWYGIAGHYICARWCQFHLFTLVGPWLISTVGEYLPGETEQKIIAASAGITLSGIGGKREADFLDKLGFQEVNCGHLYETMVFRAGERCNEADCDCNMPKIEDHNSLETKSYNSRREANEGHLAMCKKWSKKGVSK